MADGAGILDGAEYEEVDIFLSYNHDDDLDDGRASALYDRLVKAGYSVWYDRNIRGGENWQTAIQVNLRRSRLIVALWSRRSVASDWCKVEAINAAAADKLFPVLMEDLARGDFSDAMHDATAMIQRAPYDAPDLLDQIASRVTASRADAERKREASARAILASKKAHLPEVLASGQPDLFGRDVEESLLLDAWGSCAPGADPAKKTNLVVLYAIGGAGKTALMRRLTDDLGATDFPNAEKVIGWSAYSQGSGDNRNADADSFISTAIDQMGFEGQKPTDSVARARLLAGLMQKKRTLLLLDGIEPLQSPPHVNLGRLKDKGLAALLIELARDNPGLVVVTSRQPLPETEKIPRVRNHALDELKPQAGAALLKRLGCWGASKDLEAASKEADGHALTITALGGYIEAVESGDIRKRDHFRLGDITFTAEEMAAPDPTVRAAKKAAHVMQGYIAAFEALSEGSKGDGVAERVLLNIIGLFDRPADGPAVKALLDGEPIAGLTDEMTSWSPQQKVGRIAAAKKRLRTLSLLNDADLEDKDALDAHPIVRAHFSKALKEVAPEAFRAAHDRLYRLYAGSCVKELPDTLDEMTPLFHAIGHGCAAGLHQEVWNETYGRRVRRRGDGYISKRLGAFGADLGALANFFELPWSRLAEGLSAQSSRGAAVNYAAASLRALGRVEESEEAELIGLTIAIDEQNWSNAAISAGNLTELRGALGKVPGAIEAGQQAVDFADRSENTFQMIAMRTSYADALTKAGRFDEATRLFLDAEARQLTLDNLKLYALAGYLYCDLLLALGRVSDARERAQYTSNLLESGGLTSLLTKSLVQLAIGRVLASLAAHHVVEPDLARDALDKAVDTLRRTAQDIYLTQGLLERSVHLRRTANFIPTEQDLEEVLDIATRGGMRLYLTDHAFESARLALAQIANAPPEKLIPLIETVEIVEDVPKLSFLDKLMGKKPAEPVRRTEERVVSPPPAPWARRAAPLTDAERSLLADAETHYARAFELVQQTGYHRRDPELADLRARLDALARL